LFLLWRFIAHMWIITGVHLNDTVAAENVNQAWDCGRDDPEKGLADPSRRTVWEWIRTAVTATAG